MFGLMPRIILYDLLFVLNSTSTTQSLLLIEFKRLGLLIALNALPNKAKHKASSIVLLPEPLEPTTKVFWLLSNFISVK
jgi:hypothetical protein